MGLSNTIKNALGRLTNGNRGATGGRIGGSTGGRTGGSASASLSAKIRSFLNRR